MQSSALTIDRALAIGSSRTLSSALWIGAFALLTAVGAQIVIPVVPVPFTLQTVFVLLSGAMLGARKGALAQIAYLGMGAVGLPVFAGFSGTFLHLLGPTGGYLVAFPLAAYLTGLLLHQSPVARLPRYLAAVVAMIPAMAVVFALGVAQLNLVVFHDWNASIVAGFSSLQIWDAAKILVAAGLASQLGRFSR